jgi:thiamine biosynthesis lipoprotein
VENVSHGLSSPVVQLIGGGRVNFGSGNAMIVAMPVVLLALVAMGAPNEEPLRFEYRQTHMGSEFKIVLYTTQEAEARRASDAAYARIAALDKALSDYDPESELMKLCDRAGGPPVAVSDDLFRCLEASQAMSERSGGAFDCTIGPVGRLWRRARRTGVMPDPVALEKARALVGFRNVELDRKARTVRLLKPGMKLDFGGIAKGFACDEAQAALKKCGIESALVAGAGDIVVSAPPPGESGWVIGVASPDDDPGKPHRFLSVRNAAVSTAGDSERFVEIGGRRYSHIVDPATGIGVVQRASVTVVAKTGAVADSLDTAAFVLGPKRGLRLIEDHNALGLFLVAGDEPGSFASRGWKERN